MTALAKTAPPAMYRNTVVLTVFQVVGLAASFALSVVLARVLGPAGKGSFSLLQLVPGLLYTIANLGLSGAVVYVAARHNESRPLVLRQATEMGLLAQTVVLAAAAAASPWLIPAFFPGLPQWMVFAMGATSILVVPAQLLYAVLVSRGQTVAASIPAPAGQVFLAVSVAIAFMLGGATLAVAVVAAVVATFVSFALTVVFSRAILAERGREDDHRTIRRELLSFGSKAWLANAMTFLNYRQDMFLLSYYLDLTQVGLYSLGVTFAELLWYVPNAISGTLFPKVALLDSEESRQLTNRTLRISSAVTALAVVLTAVIVPPLVPIIFGEAFKPAIPSMIALLPGTFALGVAKILSSDLAGRGRVLHSTRSSAINLVVNLAANVILIPVLGILGAALASSLSYTASFLVMTLAYKRETGSRVSEMFFLRSDDVAALRSATIRFVRR